MYCIDYQRRYDALYTAACAWFAEQRLTYRGAPQASEYEEWGFGEQTKRELVRALGSGVKNIIEELV